MRNDLLKIGIFGGTFNPVHNGHVATAKFFIERAGIDLLYVIPTNISPLKDPAAASAQDRFEMLKLAFEGISKVAVSDIELKREGTSYTFETIGELRKMHPKSRLYYLIGDDWLVGFDTWRNYEYILANARIVVANRSGRDLSEELRAFRKLTGKRPLVLDNPVVIASSTGFRAAPDASLVPEKVFEYIKERNLYGV